jgi:hypothetical protein
MPTNTPTRELVERKIRQAFAGVTLGAGVSLRQAVASDDGRSYSPAEWDALKTADVVDDWSRVPPSTLETDCLAFLDGEGFRYYLPILMLSVLDEYDPGSRRVIGTLLGLYPKKESFEYAMERYAALSTNQKRAVATFLEALPDLVSLWPSDAAIVRRALRNYWHKFSETHESA